MGNPRRFDKSSRVLQAPRRLHGDHPESLARDRSRPVTGPTDRLLRTRGDKIVNSTPTLERILILLLFVGGACCQTALASCDTTDGAGLTPVFWQATGVRPAD